MTPTHCLLSPASHPSLGDNLNGPCVVEVPDWVPAPLGRYYLYFAHHEGLSIRMAYADTLKGPWTVYAPGVLQLHETPYLQNDIPPERGLPFCYAHIAAPNAHIDDARQEIIMYYHGLVENGSQPTRVCSSKDGLTFGDHSKPLLPPYFAGFCYNGALYGVAWGGTLFKAADWRGPFVKAPPGLATALTGPNGERPRHFGVTCKDQELTLYFSRIGDAPERIMKATCALTGDWRQWRASSPVEVLRPSETWHGADAPITPSKIGTAPPMEHGIRDPFPFQDYLFFSGGGESNIGIVRL